MTVPAVHRIFAQLFGNEPMELWRGRYAPSENALLSYADEMSANWHVWVQSPMHDARAIGRVAMIDFGYVQPKAEIEAIDQEIVEEAVA